jgi:hypothetical protein
MTLAQMPAALAAWRWRRRYIAGMLDGRAAQRRGVNGG